MIMTTALSVNVLLSCLIFLAASNVGVEAKGRSHGNLRRLEDVMNMNLTMAPSMNGTMNGTSEDSNSEEVFGESDVACGYTVCPSGTLCCGNTFCVTDASLCTITSTTQQPTVPVAATQVPTTSPMLPDLPTDAPTTSAPSSPPSLFVAPLPPPNDLCTTAEGPLPITSQSLNGSLEIRTMGTTVGASTQSELGPCGGTIQSPSVWYTVVGNGARLMASTCWPGTTLDTQVSVFRSGTSSCNSLQCIGGNDDAAGATCESKPLASKMIWQSQVGEVYYIVVFGFVSRVGDFELSIEATNDQCQHAIELSVGDTIRGDTIPAQLPFGGVFDNCGGTGLIGGGPALWYQVAGTGDMLQATACPDPNGLRPVRISMFEDSCDSYDSCVGGDDPDSGCATYEWESEAGTTYYILVHSQAPYSAGFFDLTISNSDGGSDLSVGRSEMFDGP